MYFQITVKIIKLIVTNVSLEDLRYSYGVGVTWITGFGPMSFAIASPS